MKIQKSQIKLPGHLLSKDLLRTLQQNSSLNVRIINVLNDKNAVLDIGGKRLKAEFLQGVPGSKNLHLILQRKVNNTFYFKISASKDSEIIGEIIRFTVLNNSDIDKGKLYTLKSELKSIHSIFALNAALLKLSGLTDSRNNSRKTAALFNLLLTKGVKYSNLQLISSLINGKDLPAFRITDILSKLLPDFSLLYKSKLLFDRDNLSKTVNEFMNSLKNNITDKKNTDDIRPLLDLLLSESLKNSPFGNIIYFDEKEFKVCDYIFNKNNIFISLNLSHLGELDIIIRDEGSNLIISFCSDEKDINLFLEKNITDLYSGIKNYYNKNVHVFFHNRVRVIEKIIEIISSLNQNYLLDLKV
ncbi:MAG: hypothetical protein JW864_02885 [Spirochaetes bacterium]|nr:hypothetical protein [Spirochaetota bacterium]